MKCSRENVILRGIVHVVSCFPLHFMLYRGNLDYFSEREQWNSTHRLKSGHHAPRHQEEDDWGQNHLSTWYQHVWYMLEHVELGTTDNCWRSEAKVLSHVTLPLNIVSKFYFDLGGPIFFLLLECCVVTLPQVTNFKIVPSTALRAWDTCRRGTFKHLISSWTQSSHGKEGSGLNISWL